MHHYQKDKIVWFFAAARDRRAWQRPDMPLVWQDSALVTKNKNQRTLRYDVENVSLIYTFL